MIKRNCKNCKKEFFTFKYRIKSGRGKFCSRICHDIFQKGKLPWNAGKKCPSLSKSKLGDKNPMWRGGISKKESDKKYFSSEKGKETKKRSQKKYYSKEENKQKKRDWVKNKIKTDIHFKLKRSISNGVWCKIKRNRKSFKDRKIGEYLPYSIKELKEHLEKQFTEGMTWNNYGKWHIDHKIPDSSFNYTSTKDKGFQDSWALKNLQPLWAIDNIIKGAKYKK